MYGQKGGYESIQFENPTESEGSCFTKVIKYLIFIVIFLILALIVFFLFRHYKIKDHSGNQVLINPSNKKYSFSDFNDIFPKTELNGNTISDIKELFKSRKLFINEKNITNDYIRFLRPINLDEEAKYKVVSSQNYLKEDYSIRRKDQMNLQDFYILCDKQTFLESNANIHSEEPIISIIISYIHNKPEIIRSINSIQAQTFKNYEIIIVNDYPFESNVIFDNILQNEPRSRIFKHSRKMGLWRTRLDGFLYSRGKYVLHFDPGDILADNYVLEDIYNLILKYNLDTVRFTFSKTRYNYDFTQSKKFNDMKIYPERYTRIIYGRPDYDVHIFGYGTIWNRLFRANVFVKGLDLIDTYLLNVYKDLWEDMWWNDLIDRVSFSNLVVNRLGYIYLHDQNSASEPKIKDDYEKDKTIREFICFWLFDYELLPKTDNKKKIIEALKNYSKSDNKFCGLPMRLNFLLSNCPTYDYLLTLLYNDQYVSNEDKIFIQELYNKVPKNI